MTRPRSGIALGIVLICLLVMMMIGAALIRATTSQHRQARVSADRDQSVWLAESAVQRAVYSLKKSPQYSGETWNIPAETLGTGLPAVAVIRIEKSSDSKPGFRVRVEARVPDDPVRGVVQIREFVVKRDAEK